MTKTKHPMDAKRRKKMNKELRTATLQPNPILRSDSIKGKDLLSRLPAKIQKKEAASLKAFEKNFKIATEKKKKIPSKRTTPGTVDAVSSPRSPHIEGQRWIKTVATQTTTKRKALNRKMAKKR